MKKALLERPVYGNAIYVLGLDWKRLSRLSKRELLADETHGVTKIVHRGLVLASRECPGPAVTV